MPCLCALTIQQPCTYYTTGQGNDVQLQLPVGFGTLSARLMRLDFAVTSVHPDNDSVPDGTVCLLDTTPAMQAVGSVLESLTALRQLKLHAWSAIASAENDVEPCWQALARALPTLFHLTRIQLLDLLVPQYFDSACFLALAAGLASLTSLHSLTVIALRQYESAIQLGACEHPAVIMVHHRTTGDIWQVWQYQILIPGIPVASPQLDISSAFCKRSRVASSK